MLDLAIVLILLGAELYNAFLARTGMPQVAAHWVADLGVSGYLIMAVVVLIYILLGCLMDSLSMLLLTIPIFYPIVMGLDFFGLPVSDKSIWFWILVGIGLAVVGKVPRSKGYIVAAILFVIGLAPALFR